MSQAGLRMAGKTLHPAFAGIDPATVIDKKSPVPLHHQLELFLRRVLEQGVIKPHELLPTEQELQEYFLLSRTPIRQALNKLVAEGLIDRRRSLGTVALPKPFEEQLRSLTTFTEEAQGKGLRPGSQLLRFGKRPADAEEAFMLGMQEGDALFVVERLRFINDEPVGIITSHVPVQTVPLLRAEDFTASGPQQSIYYVFEHLHGLRPVRASETFRAVTLEPDTAALLRLPPHSAVLMRARVTFDTLGRALAYEVGLYRSVYRLEWSGRDLSVMETAVPHTVAIA